MKTERFGYAAFDKESGKGLSVVVGMISSAKTSLTDNPDKIYISESYGEIEIGIKWFNNQHKNQKEFEIKQVVKTIEVREV